MRKTHSRFLSAHPGSATGFIPNGGAFVSGMAPATGDGPYETQKHRQLAPFRSQMIVCSWFFSMQCTFGTIRDSEWRATIIAVASRRLLLRRSGLSLIELTMVLLVMGILSAVAAPRLTSQLNQHSVGSVRSLLQTDLKAAQQEALSTSASVTVSIDKLQNSYSITANRNGAAKVLKTVQIDDDPWNSVVTSILKGSARTSVNTISLTINGAGVFAENVEINLASGTATARATVDAATGRILVE